MATIMTMATSLPVFLVGGLSVQIRAEMAFDRTGLGLAAAAFFATSAVTAVAGGSLGERLGARNALRLAMLLGAAALLGIGLVATSWWHLVTLLGVAGVADAIAQPTSNMVVARVASARHHGFAFGLKQSAIPFAALVAGSAVPLVALRAGWRWAFIGAAALALALLAAAASQPITRMPVRAGGRWRPGQRRPLIMLAAVGLVGGGSATAMATFFVDSAVARGLSSGVAGIWLVAGSICCIFGVV